LIDVVHNIGHVSSAAAETEVFNLIMRQQPVLKCSEKKGSGLASASFLLVYNLSFFVDRVPASLKECTYFSVFPTKKGKSISKHGCALWACRWYVVC